MVMRGDCTFEVKAANAANAGASALLVVDTKSRCARNVIASLLSCYLPPARLTPACLPAYKCRWKFGGGRACCCSFLPRGWDRGSGDNHFLPPYPPVSEPCAIMDRHCI